MSAPLTPPDCDVRGLPYMPVEVGRLLESDFFALSSGDQFKAAMALWCRSWTQVPAASLPSDERLLARAAGVALGEWRDIAEVVLHGWVACDDGRLYHPVVAEKALRGWIERIGLKDRSAKGNATRHDGFRYDPADFAERKAEAVRYLARLIPGAASEFGVSVPEGTDTPPPRTTRPRQGTPPATVSASEEKVTEHNGTERKGRPLVVSAAPSPTPDVQAAVQLYNETAEELGLPTARKLSEARRKKLISTLREHGPDVWAEAMQHLRRSPHCRGQNDRGWKADLDFLLTPSRFLRLIEGAYSGSATTPARGASWSYLDVALEAAA